MNSPTIAPISANSDRELQSGKNIGERSGHHELAKDLKLRRSQRPHQVDLVGIDPDRALVRRDQGNDHHR